MQKHAATPESPAGLEFLFHTCYHRVLVQAKLSKEERQRKDMQEKALAQASTALGHGSVMSLQLRLAVQQVACRPRTRDQGHALQKRKRQI